MASCTEFEPLLAERASGDESPADAVRLDGHLATCAHCRGELAAYQRALGLARLPPPTDAERQALAHVATRARADLQHAPLFKALWRLLTLTAVAAGIAVVFANKVILPGAERRAAQQAAAAAATWTEPDPESLLRRVEKEHPELAVANENGLARAEAIADAAYVKAIGGAE